MMNDLVDSNEPSRRGRPPRAETVQEMSSRDPVTQQRSPRVRFQSDGKMNVPAHLLDDNYRYYWPTDKPGELEQMQAAWYEFVEVNGKHVTVPAGNGLTHHLMRIEKKFFEEDMQAQQAELDERERNDLQIRQGEYSPNDGRNGVGSSIRKERDIH